MGMLSLISQKAVAQDSDTIPSPHAKIQTIDWKDVFTLITHAESEATNKGCINVLELIPDINLSVNIKDKYKVSALANYSFNNWGGDFIAVPFSMYVDGAVKTKVGTFGARVGRILPHGPYCIEAEWDQATPLGAQFFSAIYLNCVGNFPKAAIARWAHASGNISLGYLERDKEKSGFAFDGTNPALVGAAEQSFAGGALRIKIAYVGTHSQSGRLYVLCNPTTNLELLANCVNIGTKQIGATAGQKYKIETDSGMLIIQGTQIWQKDGVAGIWFTLCFMSGININIGALKNDPRFEYDSVQPWLGIGYNKVIKFKEK